MRGEVASDEVVSDVVDVPSGEMGSCGDTPNPRSVDGLVAEGEVSPVVVSDGEKPIDSLDSQAVADQARQALETAADVLGRLAC
jgi:hypothetical protein